ncbi:MAG: hypothetical protein E3J88_01960 [Anaerolineales bacterium]|nr:MAG: hypothetical protein E3J88_01960 [Anaerolineales bacterium]
MNSNQSKSLKLTAIIFMGMTAAMNLLGGIGTVCAAFIKKYAIVLGVMKLREFDYTWLYKIFMFVAIIIGIFGIRATVKLVKGGKGVFKNALIILFIGTLASGIHYYASMQIRGEAAPANMKFFTNLLALIIFLVLNAPGLREKVDFSKPGGDAEKTGGGLAAIMAGLLTLTTFFWVGESHIYLGESWVNDLDITLIVLGTGFLVFGLGLITSVVLGKVRQLKEKSAVDMS